MSEKMRKKYKHHENGDVRIEIETPDKGGYFFVNHQNCPEKKKSRMGLVFTYIDGQFHQGKYTEGARLILVYQCANCGEQQVIKTILRNDIIEIEEEILNIKTREWKK